MNCPRCHAPIPADGPAGMCPKCLLSVGLGEPEVVLTANGDPAPPPPTPGELQPFFPQFEILRLVGRGGMGAVYEARQKGLARSVALKILAAPTRPDSSFEERFVREAQALARLSHENIVAVYDAGRAGPHFYLAMEYVDGPNLRQAERAGHIEPAQALALVVQICTALDYAHKNGIVHRDIKPENVLLTREGQVKIVDFGLAKVLDRAARGLSLTRMSQTMGTPHYMAPEQIEHPKDVDHRADIYSLGVVFYELLTGELPLGRFPLPSQRVTIDVRLDDIVIRTLEKEPDRRYQFAGEVRTAVQGVTSTPMQAAAPAHSAPMESRAPRPMSRILLGALIVILLIGAAAFAAVMLSGPRTVTPEMLQAGELQFYEGKFRMRELVVQALGGIPDPAAVDARTTVLRELAPVVANELPGLRAEVVHVALELAGTGTRDDPLLRYEEHVAASATKLELREKGEVAAVRVEPDGALVRKLRDELSLELRNRLHGYELAAAYIDRIVQQHLPFDHGPVEIRIRRGGGWVVEVRTPEFGASEKFEEQLPRRYRLLADLFQTREGATTSNVADPASAGARVSSADARAVAATDREAAIAQTQGADSQAEAVRGEPLQRVLEALTGVLTAGRDPLDHLQAIDIALALPGIGLRTDLLAKYRAHEAERTTLLPLAAGNEIAAARIDADPVIVGGLRQEMRRALTSSFGSTVAPDHVEWLVREHMPFETGPVEIRIERDGDGWTVRERAAGFETDVDRFDIALPRGLQRIIDRFRASLGVADAAPTELPDFAKVAPTAAAPRPERGGPSVIPSVPAVWAAARGVLANSGREIVAEYLRIEANHATPIPTRDEDIARLRIGAFPAVRATLAMALRQQLVEVFDSVDFRILRDDGFEFAVLPFGDDEYEVSIGEGGFGWKCGSERRGGSQVSTHGTDLPEPYARLLALHRQHR